MVSQKLECVRIIEDYGGLEDHEVRYLGSTRCLWKCMFVILNILSSSFLAMIFFFYFYFPFFRFLMTSYLHRCVQLFLSQDSTLEVQVNQDELNTDG